MTLVERELAEQGWRCTWVAAEAGQKHTNYTPLYVAVAVVVVGIYVWLAVDNPRLWLPGRREVEAQALGRNPFDGPEGVPQSIRDVARALDTLADNVGGIAQSLESIAEGVARIATPDEQASDTSGDEAT